MIEEINNINAIIHSLQIKVDRLEIANKELETKLLGNVAPVVNPEQQQLLLSSEKDELTVEKSIHNLRIVNILGKSYFSM